MTSPKGWYQDPNSKSSERWECISIKSIIRLIVVISSLFAVSACAKSAADKAEEEYIELVFEGCSRFYENPQYRNLEARLTDDDPPINLSNFSSIWLRFDYANDLVDSWENDDVLITSPEFINDSKKLKYEVLQALSENQAMLVNRNGAVNSRYQNREEFNSNVKKVDKYCQDDSIALTWNRK
jgi:hypothetical protein